MKEKDDIVNSRWKIIENLGGNSGQGHAYKVEDLNNENDEKFYVIKLLKKVNDKTLNRFKKEIEASINLNHPNIINVIDSEYENTNEPYLVTELCSGGELNKNKVEKLTTLEKLKSFKSICEAISYAHENKVIHRDIKPSNIFFDNQKDKNPIVGDFGLCFFETDETDERLTETLEQVGAKSFRPPEAEYGIIDEMKPSFDVYSLGKLLYWFLSNGKIPIRENITHPNFDLRKDNEDQTSHIAYEIFGKSILENPIDRYSSAFEMLEDLKEITDLVYDNARYLDCNIPQKCIFCRKGNYTFDAFPLITTNHAMDFRGVAQYGFNFKTHDGANWHGRELSMDSPQVIIARCNYCGNVQQFRLNNVEGDEQISDNWKNITELK